MTRDRRENLAGAVLLFVLISIAYLPFSFGNKTLMSSSAETASLYPTGALPDSSVRIPTLKGLDPGAAGWQTEPEFWLEHNLVVNEHVVPLWNPYSGYGEPLAADQLSQPFFPLTWLVTAHPSLRSYNWFIILRFYLAALFTFLYLRYFVRFWAAIGGGIAFAFTGYLILYFNIAHLSVECLIPALFWAFEFLVRKRGPASIVALAVAIAVVIFGGMPESALLAFGAAYLYFIVRVITDPVERARMGRTFAYGAAATVLGVGISACLMLPALEFLRLSTNQHDPRLIGGLISGHIYDPYALHYFGNYLVPLMFGPPWSNIMNGFSGWAGTRGFFGTAGAFLAIVATGGALTELRAPGRTWSPAPFFAIIAVALMLKRFGSPAVEWVGSLPGFDLINFPKYEEAEIGFCVAVLAGLGIERIASGKLQPAIAWVATVVPLALLTTITGIVRPDFLTLTMHTKFLTHGVALALVILGALAIVAWYSTTARSEARRFPIALLCTVLLATEAVMSYFVPMWYSVVEEAPITRSAPAGAPYINFLKARVALSRARFFGEDAILYPEWSAAFGISDVRDLNAMYDNRYLPFVRTLLGAQPGSEGLDRFTGAGETIFDTPLQRRFLALSSVEYIGTQQNLSGVTSQFSLVFSAPLVHIYHFAGALPRLAVYSAATAVDSDEDALEALAGNSFDPNTVALVTLDGPAARNAVVHLGGPRRAVAAGTIVTYSSQFIQGTVDARTSSLVVLNDTFYPGWAAYVDGNETPIVVANYMFRGVFVSPGHHVVVFRYRPASFRIGLIITLASILIAASLLGIGMVKAKGSP